MTKQEFFDKWSEEDLEHARVLFEKPSFSEFTYHFYEENNVWFVAYYMERGEVAIYFQGSEEEAYDELDAYASVQLKRYKRRMGIK